MTEKDTILIGEDPAIDQKDLVDVQREVEAFEFPTGEKKVRDKQKKLSRRFLHAIYHRSRAEMLPVSYFRSEVEKFCPPEEAQKLEPMLQAMVDEGAAKQEDDKYQLLES